MKKKWLCMLLMLLCTMLCMPLSGAAAEGFDAVPVLSELYPEEACKLKEISGANKENRRQAYAGPGELFASGGSYKPYKQRGVTVLYSEGEWVFTHLQYQSVGDRYLYFKQSSFADASAVPQVEEMKCFPGKTTAEAEPSWGPGDDYDTEPEFKAAAGTEVKVLFQEGDHVFAEYVCSGGRVRMWLKKAQVTLTGGEALYELPDKKAPAAPRKNSGSQSIRPTKEWSAWQDAPVQATEIIEVETRTMYRRRIEIRSWSEWRDGEPPEDIYPGDCQTRVINRNGQKVQQYRCLGYYGVYGNWTAWSEDPFRGAASSSDILEMKEQYRYRLREGQ